MNPITNHLAFCHPSPLFSSSHCPSISHSLSPRRTFPSAPNPRLAPAQFNVFALSRSTASSSPSPSPSPPPAPSSIPAPSVLSPKLDRFLRRAEEGNPLVGLERAEAAFDKLKARVNAPGAAVPPPDIVRYSNEPALSSSRLHFDVLIAGGTLGILYAAALQAAGLHVAVLERGAVQGRVQEWNISRDELGSLVSAGVLSKEQLDKCIVTECKSPGRMSFLGRDGKTRSMTVANVLDVGVAPDILVRHALSNFLSRGGVVFERHSLKAVEVCPDSVLVRLKKSQGQAVVGALGAGGTGLASTSGVEDSEEVTVTGRLLIDAMGSFSPIAEQARGGRAPDGVCITVGACMTSNAWPKQLEAPDIIASCDGINADQSAQYFWEAFPQDRDRSARSAYMFCYGACTPARQTLTSTLEDYVAAFAGYQGVDVDDVTSVKRVLFGFFPSYYRTATPAPVVFDRVLPVGDAGGLQSPISFGGFGCTARHLTRITRAVTEALADKSDKLVAKRNLAGIQWYLPSLAVTGLFHKAMSVEPGRSTAGPFLDRFGINDLLWSNMRTMKIAGKKTQLAFLRDVSTAHGLAKTMALMNITDPILTIKVLAFVGVVEIVRWLKHFFALVAFAIARPIVMLFCAVFVAKISMSSERTFWWNRLKDALTYGSGHDAEIHSH